MKKVLLVFLFLTFLALPLVASAAIDPVITICNLLNKIKIIIAAVGFGIAAIMLIAGGISYMAAGGDPEKATKAKKLIINSLIGMAIVVGAVFLLALVEGLLSGAGVSLIGNPCGSM